jgi:hypothetical protein
MADDIDTQAPEPSVEANGNVYKLSDLNDTARANLTSYRFAESEVKRLQRELALAKTAVAAYRRALIQNLPEAPAAAEQAAAAE